MANRKWLIVSVALMPFFLVSLLRPSPVLAGADTSYVKSYYSNFVPKLLTNYKNLSVSFANITDTLHVTDHFSTGGQNYIGAELNYKWASLGYSFGFNNENSATNTDLRFSTSFGPFRIQTNYTDLKNLEYYRVSGINQTDTTFIPRQHNVELETIGIKIDYVFNHKKFYYPSSISNSGQQLKSKGSVVLSSGVYYQNFDLHGLSDSSGTSFLNRYRASQIKTTRVEAGLGYAYNWVINKRFSVYISDVPNWGVEEITTFSKQETRHNLSVNITNYVRGGFMYTWHNKFIGMYAYNSVATNSWSGYQYSNVYTSFQLQFGWVLSIPKTNSLFSRL